MAIPGFHGNGPDHLELTPEQDTVVRAVFVPKRYRISVETDSHLVERGTVEIEGHPGADAVMAEYGSTVTIKRTRTRAFVSPIGRMTNARSIPSSS